VGNLTIVVAPDTPNGYNNTTTYTYNGMNQLWLVSMQAGSNTQTRQFNYDNTTGRLMSVVTPESGTVSYLYNNDGTVQSKTDAKMQRTAYVYDAYQRVTEVDRYLSGGQRDACQTVNYIYDVATVNELGTAANGVGRVTQRSWSSPNCQYNFYENYAYQGNGLIFVKQMVVVNTLGGNVTPIWLTANFQYDNEGRMSTVSPPNASSVTYSYDRDALGREQDLYTGPWQSPTMVVNGVSYNAAGQMTGMTYIGNFSETRTYNPNGQMTNQTATPAGGGSGMNLNYNYAAGVNDGRFALAGAQGLDKILTAHNVKQSFTEAPGVHEWKVWRFALHEFAPLLFQ
jgi:YD repeat-containing protein